MAFSALGVPWSMAKNTAFRTFSGATARLRSRCSCRDLASTLFLERHAITVWTVVDLLSFERSPNRPLGVLQILQKSRNSLFGANLLAIVVEVDVTALRHKGDRSGRWPPRPALRAGCRSASNAGGRPEVKNTVLRGSSWTTSVVTSSCATSTTSKIRTSKRRARPARTGLTRTGDVGPARWQSDRSLDEDGAHPLTELFLADHLIVDTSRPFADASF